MKRPRYWIGKTNFEGKQPFCLGTVVAESELEAERLLFDLWNTLMPYDPPRSFTVIPGRILFVEEENA